MAEFAYLGPYMLTGASTPHNPKNIQYVYRYIHTIQDNVCTVQYYT